VETQEEETEHTKIQITMRDQTLNLQSQIQSLIRTYEEETGMTVKEVTLDRSMSLNLSGCYDVRSVKAIVTPNKHWLPLENTEP